MPESLHPLARSTKRRPRRPLALTGSTVAITGGAGGLGQALARNLLHRGARVAVLDVDAHAATGLADRLGPPERIAGWAADVRDRASLDAAFAAAEHHFGGIDVVVAAAGVLPPFAALDRTTDRDWERAIDINLSGVWRTFAAATPYVARRGGHMVAMSSMIAFLHSPMLSGYAASKAGVWALCDAARLELAPQGVTVGSVHPIMFRTPMIDAITDDPSAVELTDNFSGPSRTLPVDHVARAVVHAIERRAAHVVVPRRLGAAAIAPGLFQAIAEFVAFRPSKIRRVLAAADQRDERASKGVRSVSETGARK